MIFVNVRKAPLFKFDFGANTCQIWNNLLDGKISLDWVGKYVRIEFRRIQKEENLFMLVWAAL